tara:strand:+ start:2260 stop:2760 length:501 start_codon:yes stop_codon:yes gene_type:complete
MWVIAKIDKKKRFLFYQDLKQKFGEEFIMYSPKILIKKFFRNKENKKVVIDLLGDYMFCFHKNFKDERLFNVVKYCRGLKYFLNGYQPNQKNIKYFIEICQKSENSEGFLSYDFFQIDINKKYKILSGPLMGQIVEIIDKQKKKIDFTLGNIKTTINKNSFLLRTV